MSLNTLLEAAKYLEMQELKEQQQKQQRIIETIVPSPITIKTTQIPTKQTVLLAMNDLVQTTTATTTTKITLTNGSSGGGVFSNNNNNNNSIINQNNLKIREQHNNVIVTATAGLPTLTTTTSEQQQQQRQQRFLNNSFDILNQINVDGSIKNCDITNIVVNTTSTTSPVTTIASTTGTTTTKRKQPPMIFRAGTREVHNKLEKHRRAHLKECFDILKKQLPQQQDEKKTSNLSILHSALRCIQALKRKERELEHEMERLARDKISAQQRLAILKKDIQQHYDNVDFTKILPEILPITTTTTQTTIINDEINHKSDNINNNNNNNTSNNNNNQNDRIPIPLLPNKTQISVATNQVGTIKEITTQQQQQQPVQQTTALSVLPVTYPVSQGLVLQKLAIVPKNLTDLTPLVSTHFITTTTTTQQQLNGKVVPLVNAQYVVKPVVVVSRPS